MALGHTTKLRWNEPSEWIWSEQPAHLPLIGTDSFERAQRMRRARGDLRQRGPRRTARPYSLRGLLFCDLCKRRMQGSWNNDAAYYRCMFLSQYAAANKIDHPRAVYLREDQVVPGLDDWLVTSLRPDALERTVLAMLDAQQTGTDEGTEQARKVIAACDAKMRQHRAALEAGADPAIIAGWMTETQAERDAAQRRRIRPASRRARLSQADIAELVASIADLTSALTSADAAAKAEIYRELGLRLTYSPYGPQGRTVQVEARPMSGMYVKSVRGGT